MDVKTILIIGCLLFVFLSGSCGVNDITDSIELVKNAGENIKASVSVNPDAIMDQECLNAAQAELAPHWISMSKVNRAVIGFRVVTTCAER